MNETTLIAQLERDHARSRQLLDLLSEQLDEVKAEKLGDFELIRDVMEYMTHYPDLIHHPVEEKLSQHVVEDISQGGLRKRLAHEHVMLAEKGKAFLEAVSRVVDGGLALRSDIVEHGFDYVQTYREHLSWEETHLFPASARLSESTMATVAAQIESQTDPLFGPIRQDEYAELWRHIQRQA